MSKYSKGLVRALLFYLIGVIVIIGTHLIFGQKYIYTRPLSFIPLLFFAFLAFIRALYNIKQIRSDKDTALNKGELTLFAFPSIAFVVLILSLCFLE